MGVIVLACGFGHLSIGTSRAQLKLPDISVVIRYSRVIANSGSYCRTEKPGVPKFMGLQRVEHDLATKQ